MHVVIERRLAGSAEVTTGAAAERRNQRSDNREAGWFQKDDLDG
jgi:hypothetical protein